MFTVIAEPPAPSDFVEYLPYACRQLGIEEFVCVKKITVGEPHKYPAESKKSKGLYEESSAEGEESDYASAIKLPLGFVRVLAGFDKHNDLVKIEIDKHCTKPREVLMLIKQLLIFHPNIRTFISNGHIDKYTVPELCTILATTDITELTLDDTFIVEGNYDLLLDGINCLKYLSLERCKINDTVVEKITSKLVWPSQASKTLTTLNLATNFVTDKGAKYFADMLRKNRNLCYLNLSDNLLTDVGAVAILSTCGEFPLTNKEIIDKRKCYYAYFKEREELIKKMALEAEVEELKPSPGTKRQRSQVIKTPRDPEEIAESIMGQFIDPFAKEYVFFKNDLLHCHGNKSLCYLNLSYNNLSYISLVTAVEVMKKQRDSNSKCLGLIYLNIEGNPIPFCDELIELDDLIKSTFSDPKRTPSKTLRTPKKQ